MRQAVVVIHGIGEQRPMSTLRGFVSHVLPVAEQNRSRMFSKPDNMSDSFELRRLIAEGSRSRPATDFYEYYWAHHMEGTKLRHVWPWVRAILLRLPNHVPRQLRTIWLVSWALALCAAIGFAIGQSELDAGVWSTPWISWALAIAFVVVQAIAISWLGDAARYLSPSPANIAVRHAIRFDGVELLRRLHRDGRYDRIVVVGHSLGSVIGYDILTILWSQLNTRHGKPDCRPQPRLNQVESLGRLLSSDSSLKDVGEFQAAQRELWLEQRQLGFPWLVTDFITLGSPLAYADLLLANDRADLRLRQEQRELPTCPPAEDRRRRNSERGDYHYVETYRIAGRPCSLRILHHAALFAETRWSNIYFPARFGVLGDLVGGPLRPVFGPGISDVAVTEGILRLTPLLSHTRYWRGRGRSANGRPTALAVLSHALSLNSSGWLPP